MKKMTLEQVAAEIGCTLPELYQQLIYDGLLVEVEPGRVEATKRGHALGLRPTLRSTSLPPLG